LGDADPGRRAINRPKGAPGTFCTDAVQKPKFGPAEHVARLSGNQRMLDLIEGSQGT
jgi:hypothetical protein